MPNKAKDISLHQAHPYPCKFPGSLVKNYLNNVSSNDIVLDPYCGSGTTLLEAARLGCSTIGIDCNPIAILISQCKLVNLNEKDISLIKGLIDTISNDINNLGTIQNNLHSFEGKDHWFSIQSQKEISHLLQKIKEFEKNKKISIVLKTALSAIINRVSNQDTETRYARVDKGNPKGYTLDLFQKKVTKLTKGILERGEILSKFNKFHLGDIRQSAPLEDNSVDLIITSPPYANTMDYYLYHKQRMNILNYEFRDVLKSEIGSRHEFSSKKAPVKKWNEDYIAGINEMARVLKKNSNAFIVIGDSQISGELLSGADLTKEAAKISGLKYKLLESIPMAGKSKSFSSSFQRPNKFEHVIRLTK
jgi:DNA modification methylase